MKEKFKKFLHKIIHLNSSPPEIALGIAVGAFICVLPLYGLHTVLMVGAALLIPKANKIAIFIGTNVSLPPTLPFITWAGYEVGRFILPKDYPPLTWNYFLHFDFRNIGDFYYPLFIGSVILGIICAVVLYFLTLLAVTLWRQRRSG